MAMVGVVYQLPNGELGAQAGWLGRKVSVHLWAVLYSSCELRDCIMMTAA